MDIQIYSDIQTYSDIQIYLYFWIFLLPSSSPPPTFLLPSLVTAVHKFSLARHDITHLGGRRGITSLLIINTFQLIAKVRNSIIGVPSETPNIEVFIMGCKHKCLNTKVFTLFRKVYSREHSTYYKGRGFIYKSKHKNVNSNHSINKIKMIYDFQLQKSFQSNWQTWFDAVLFSLCLCIPINVFILQYNNLFPQSI